MFNAHQALLEPHRDFAQVDPVVERVPGALLVVGLPGLLKDLPLTLALRTLQAIAARDARRARDAVDAGVPLTARDPRRSLQAAGVL